MKIMKKLNNRGFLLVETVIVSVFVLTLFVLVYQNCLPMIQEYNQRVEYDDMDSIYAIDLFRRLIIHDPKYKTFLDEVNSVGYKDMGDCSIYSPDRQGMCAKLKEYLGVTADNRVYLTRWEIENLDTLNSLPRGYLEYIQYVKVHEQAKNTEYRLLFSHTVRYNVYEYNDSVTVHEKAVNHFANIGM